jgi:peptidyl-prolyl cis-trans isomerase D
MFDSIRKQQRLLMFVLLILIIPAFVFFGVQGYDQFLGNDDSVAKVGRQKISRGEFEQAQRRQLEQFQQMFGANFDAKMLDNDASRMEILDGLIAQKVLSELAIDNKLSVSDERLRQALLRIPGLQKPDGSFDMERYRAALSQQNLDLITFESQLRRDIALQAIPEALGQTVVLPDAVVDRLVVLQEQKREIRTVAFAPKAFGTGLNPTEEQLKKTFDANAKAFEEPERAKVEYLVLDLASISATIAVDPAKVREYFEQNKARYATAEQRQASHILVAVAKDAAPTAREQAKSKAKGLLEKAKAGADFAKLARENSDDKGSATQGGDLGVFAQDAMVKPFADATFAMKVGDISDLVETEFGYHIIKLTNIKSGSQPSFDAVKPAIEEEFRKQEAAREYAKQAEAFTNTVYEQSESLGPAAEKFKLKVQTAEQVTRQGPAPGAGQQTAAVLRSPKVLNALFTTESIKSKRNIEAQEVAPNTLVAARIVEHQPASTKPFEQVKAEVRAQWVREESLRLAGEAAQSKLKEVQGGAKADWGVARVIGRAQAAELPADSVAAIFKLPTTNLPTYTVVQDVSGNSLVVQLTQVQNPNDEQIKARRDALRAQFSASAAQQEINAFLESVKGRIKIEKNLSRIGAGRTAAPN